MLMERYEGGCHCGNIRVAFHTAKAVADWPVRACQCSFCRKHNVRATGDPEGRLEIAIAEAGGINRYRFGLGITDFLICRRCGTYAAALVEEPEGLLATLIVNVLDLPQDGFPEPAPAHYDDETAEERLARRRLRWTPAVLLAPGARVG